MSGSGGFYKYRCKYWLSHNCPNWLWVPNSACANCMAEGRDPEETAPAAPQWRPPEICVPRILDGMLVYTIMEIVGKDESGKYWMLRQKTALELPPAGPRTTDVTPGVAMTATTGPVQRRF